MGAAPDLCEASGMSSCVRLIRSTTLAGTAEHACAAEVPAEARLVFLDSARPLNADGTTAARGNCAGQAAECLGALREALAEAGGTLDDVVHVRVLVASSERSDLAATWRVVRDAFGAHDVPSTLLGVTCLAHPHQLVEIEATAAVVD
jgi:enamine deaminase RidA (YjgF/YER057c/UK114 family)